MEGQVKTTPESTAKAIKELAAAVDRMPEEVATLHAAILYRLNNGPRIEADDGYAHIAAHLQDIAPLLMNDEKLRPSVDRLAGESGSSGESGPSGAEPELAPVAIGLGIAAAAAVVLAVVAIVEYCVVGPSPEPGESLPTSC
jgi:hypothetical protein